MADEILVRKHSGELQPFSEKKLAGSLQRSGASDELIQAVLAEIRPQIVHDIPTRDIYRWAFELLRKKMHSVAARYSLKKAIMELGPSGYPFEKFVGEIFKKRGYSVLVGQTIKGKCVRHEVDVVAEKDGEVVMVECKYHNEQGKESNVQVPLYINSRFLDIQSTWLVLPENVGKKFRGWVVTNTRFTIDAQDYGTCAGMHLLSWDFPVGNSLKDIVERMGLFPVTVLTGLTDKQKQVLLNQGIILCTHLYQNQYLLNGFGLAPQNLKEVVNELADLCTGY